MVKDPEILRYIYIYIYIYIFLAFIFSTSIISQAFIYFFPHSINELQFKNEKNMHMFNQSLFLFLLLDLIMLLNFDAPINLSSQSNLTENQSFHANTSLIFSFILFSAYAIVFFVSFIANIFVIIIIIIYRRMRTLTNRFLLNLAISDLLATLICLPPNAYHHHYDKRWIFGEFLCRFVPFMQGKIVLRKQTNIHELMIYFREK